MQTMFASLQFFNSRESSLKKNLPRVDLTMLKLSLLSKQTGG